MSKYHLFSTRHIFLNLSSCTKPVEGPVMYMCPMGTDFPSTYYFCVIFTT